MTPPRAPVTISLAFGRAVHRVHQFAKEQDVSDPAAKIALASKRLLDENRIGFADAVDLLALARDVLSQAVAAERGKIATVDSSTAMLATLTPDQRRDV